MDGIQPAVGPRLTTTSRQQRLLLPAAISNSHWIKKAQPGYYNDYDRTEVENGLEACEWRPTGRTQAAEKRRMSESGE
jgi:hypothetical protein